MPQIGLNLGIWGCCEVMLGLEPQIVLVILNLSPLFHHFEIFESRQIKFAPQVQFVWCRVLGVLTELIQSLNSSIGVDIGEVVVPIWNTTSLAFASAALTELPTKLGMVFWLFCIWFVVVGLRFLHLLSLTWIVKDCILWLYSTALDMFVMSKVCC